MNFTLLGFFCSCLPVVQKAKPETTMEIYEKNTKKHARPEIGGKIRVGPKNHFGSSMVRQGLRGYSPKYPYKNPKLVGGFKYFSFFPTWGRFL